MTLTSPAFNKGDVIPRNYTCDVKENATNPPLLISNIPPGTESLALFLEDVDQPTAGRLPTVHWAVFNIPSPASGNTVIAIPEGYSSTSGILQAQNDLSEDEDYASPCPPAGKSHEYHFSVYALRVANIITTANLNLSNVLTSTTFKDTVSGNIIQDAGLIGYYPMKPAAAPGPAPSPGGGGGGSDGGGGGRVGWNCPKQWSACKNGLEQRTCVDMFNQAITRIETRPCVVTAPPAPSKQAPVVQPPKPIPPAPPKPVAVVQQPAEMKAPAVQRPAPVLSMIKDSWQKYKVYVVAVPSALLIIIALILLVHHFRKPKVVYNLEELKQWVKAEKAMGTSDENVKAILAQNTGWSKKEIEKAMEEALV
jgi:Raf kinase inhibitor-like YbhB/YbcL family protein